MRALVTGGAGFIGSHVVDRLLDAGAEVLIIDDLSRGSISNISSALGRGAEHVRLDIRHGEALEAAFQSFGPDVVFHLAAQIDVRASMVGPAHDASINVLGSINVLTAACAAGVQRVVNTSTGGAIYGETADIPTREDTPANPMSAYGLSKHAVERYARWFTQQRGLDVVTLRYGNVYGPRQDPNGDAGVIAIFCDQALRNLRPTIYGNGRQTRDYVFVADIAEANVAAAFTSNLAYPEYNIGTGIEISVRELVREVAEVAGLAPEQFEPQFLPARAGEVIRSCLDVTRARRDLGTPRTGSCLTGYPSVTSLDGGLALTLDWLRQRAISVSDAQTPDAGSPRAMRAEMVEQ